MKAMQIIGFLILLSVPFGLTVAGLVLAINKGVNLMKKLIKAIKYLASFVYGEEREVIVPAFKIKRVNFYG